MPRLSPPSAVLFDLDGTLVDTVPARVEAWRRTFEEIGIRVDSDRLGPLIGIDGRQFARLIMDEAKRAYDEDDIEAADKRAGALHSEINVAPQPLPGTTLLLDALTRRAVTWAIATSSRPEQVQVSIDALRLHEPPRVVDGSHVPNAKPAPDLLLLSARQLEVEPQKCWYVGDSTWDMRAAVSAEMLAVGVTAGSAVTSADLSAAGAALVVPTLAALVVELPG